MAHASIRSGSLQAFNVISDLLAELAFGTVLLQNMRERSGFFVRKIFRSFVWVDGRLAQHFRGVRPPDTIDIGKRRFNSFLLWYINSCYAWQILYEMR